MVGATGIMKAWLGRGSWMAIGAVLGATAVALVQPRSLRQGADRTPLACAERSASVPRSSAQPRPLFASAMASVPPHDDATTSTTRPTAPAQTQRANDELRQPPRPRSPSAMLPQLPGSERLGGDAQYDHTRGTWLWVVSLRIPASATMVVDFYKRALASLGMQTWTQHPPEASERAPILVRGRVFRPGAEFSAQIGILQHRRDMLTDVRILWRWWPPAG